MTAIQKPKAKVVVHTLGEALSEASTASAECREWRVSVKDGSESVTLRTACVGESEQKWEDSAVLSAAQSSDLVAGVYEGGLKVWECALDLVQFLDALFDGFAKGKAPSRFLELGCGNALPLVWCIRRTAADGRSAERRTADSPLFVAQDLNEDVLLKCALPNVVLNVDSGDCAKVRDAVVAVSGQWDDERMLETVAELGPFHCVLAAETVYSTDSFQAFAAALLPLLTSHSPERAPVCLLAAKAWYFGVGGGTQEFRDFLKAHFQALDSCVLHRFADGTSNIREIVAVFAKESRKQVAEQWPFELVDSDSDSDEDSDSESESSGHKASDSGIDIESGSDSKPLISESSK